MRHRLRVLPALFLVRFLAPFLASFLASFLALLAGPAAVLAQGAGDPDRISPTAKYQQSEAVKARFPDVAIKLVAPSFALPAPALTSQDSMMAFLRDEVAGGAAQLIEAGPSAQGRAIPLVLLTREGVGTLAAAHALKRPAVWFIGQQHGNEPAGAEAMMALAHALAKGPLRPMLEAMTVVIIPRANPDGAARDARGAANGADLNRDHILLTQAETRGIHAAMAQLPPHVVFDHHEFSVANRWMEKFGGVQKADAMLLAATHPMVAPEVRAIANDLFQTRVEAGLARHGLVPFVYVTTSYSKSDPVVSTGGAAPGIARNAFGLTGAVSYLVETRGVGIGLEGWQRRVATHYLIAEAVLTAIRDDGARLAERLATGRAGVSASREALPVSFTLREATQPMPLVDPVTGADKLAQVTLRDSRALMITASRPRPAAYVITGNLDETEARLLGNAVRVCRLGEAIDAEVESYRITSPAKQVNREAINPEQAVTVDLVPAQRRLPAGSLYVSMAQTAAGIVSAALEPDSPGSFVGTGLLPASEGEPPIFRMVGKIHAGRLPATCAGPSE